MQANHRRTEETVVHATAWLGRRLAATVLATVAFGLPGGAPVERCVAAEPARDVPLGVGVAPVQERPAPEINAKPVEPRPASKTPTAKPTPPAAQATQPKPGPADNPEIYKQLLRSTVLIVGAQGDGNASIGTGWVVDKAKRLIVTNDHVVDETKVLLIFFPAYKNGKLVTEQDYYMNEAKPIKGTLIESDAKVDLALIRLERMPDEAVALELAARSAVPGEVVHSVGNPFAASGTVWVYTTGNVRQVHRFKSPAGKHGPAFDARVVSTQSPVNHGDSGGPVVNGRMEVVAVVSRGRTNANLMQFFVDVEEVRGHLRIALPLVEPKSAKEFNIRGVCHYRQDRYDEAVRDYAEALKLDPKMTLAMANRGMAFLEKRDYDTALADFNAAIRGGAEQDWVYKGRGRTHQAKGKFDEAVADFTEALRRNPDSAHLYNYRGLAYADSKQHAEAIADYTRAIERQPLQAAFFNRGAARTRLNQHQEAVADFSAALRMDPNNAKYLDWRAFNLFKLKQYDEALRDFNAAIKRDGDNPTYHNERGDLFYEVGEFKLAIQDYHAAVTLSPQNALYYFNRGMALRQLGAADAAAADFAKAVQLDPQFKSRIERLPKRSVRKG